MDKPSEGTDAELTKPARQSSLRRATAYHRAQRMSEEYLHATAQMSEKYLHATAQLMQTAAAITSTSEDEGVRSRIDELTEEALSGLTDIYTRAAAELRQGRNTKSATTKLQNGATSAINEGRKNDMQRFEYPEPDEEAELGAIQERSIELVQVADSVADLGLEGVDIQVRIAGLHEIANRCEQLARNIGMHAVSEGNLTQRQLSRLLGVAELTVGRWVKAAQEQQEQQEKQDQ